MRLIDLVGLVGTFLAVLVFVFRINDVNAFLANVPRAGALVGGFVGFVGGIDESAAEWVWAVGGAIFGAVTGAAAASMTDEVISSRTKRPVLVGAATGAVVGFLSFLLASFDERFVMSTQLSGIAAGTVIGIKRYLDSN